MQSSVLTLDDGDAWKTYFHSLPGPFRDVFFSPEYYAVFRSAGCGEPRCFAFADGEHKFIYPFFLKDFSDLPFASQIPGSDIEGAFGYNGALSTSQEAAFIEAYTRAFLDYCRRENVVAEFTRFNPVYRNHSLTPWLAVSSPSQNVIVDLREKEFWMRSYEHAVRKNVNKASRLGVQCRWAPGETVAPEDLQCFAAIYKATLDRHEAERRYYYDEPFFRSMAASLPRNTLFFFATHQGAIVSCELVLHNQCNAYSYLGGTLAEHYPLSPNVMLKHEIILALKTMGLESYCLGGGTTRGDGIFKYKSGFDKHGVCDFFIGKRIHNQALYDNLCRLWSARHPEKTDRYNSYVLKYRY